MKSKFRVIYCITALAFVLAFASAACAKDKGQITVCNDSGKALYISIDGYNQGELDAGESAYYEAELGEHSVEASWDDGSTRKYCRLSGTYPNGQVSFSDGDIE